MSVNHSGKQFEFTTFRLEIHFKFQAAAVRYFIFFHFQFAVILDSFKYFVFTYFGLGYMSFWWDFGFDDRLALNWNSTECSIFNILWEQIISLQFIWQSQFYLYCFQNKHSNTCLLFRSLLVMDWLSLEFRFKALNKIWSELG